MKSILLAQILTKFSYFDHILSSFPRRNRLWAGTSWLVCLPRATSEPLLTMRHRFRGASWCGLGRSCIEYRQNIKMTLQPSNVDCWYFGPHHGDEVVVVLQHRCLALNWGLSQRYWFGDIESSSKWYNMHLVFWTWASGHISDFMNSLGITSTMAVCEVNHDDHSEPGWSTSRPERCVQQSHACDVCHIQQVPGLWGVTWKAIFWRLQHTCNALRTDLCFVLVTFMFWAGSQGYWYWKDAAFTQLYQLLCKSLASVTGQNSIFTVTCISLFVYLFFQKTHFWWLQCMKSWCLMLYSKKQASYSCWFSTQHFDVQTVEVRQRQYIKQLTLFSPKPG